MTYKVIVNFFTDWLLEAAQNAGVIQDEPTSGESEAVGPPSAKTPRSLFASYQRPHGQSRGTPISTVLNQYITYIQAITNGQEHGKPWELIRNNKQFKCLSPLFEKVFSTPCTSAPVERVFSYGGLFMRPHRARLGDKVLCDLMIARCNQNKKLQA